MNDLSIRSPGIVPISAVTHLTGLEYVRQIVSGEIGNPPIADLMNFRAVEAEEGEVTFAGTPGRDVYNLIETVHGGYAATMLDTVMALAIFTTQDARSAFTTLEIKINYARAITAGTGEVFARGKAILAGRKVATAEGRLTDKNGKLLAFGTTTCLIVPKER
jgi:uncharacterized protein (TIGR00369 family)